MSTSGMVVIYKENIGIYGYIWECMSVNENIRQLYH